MTPDQATWTLRRPCESRPLALSLQVETTSAQQDESGYAHQCPTRTVDLSPSSSAGAATDALSPLLLRLVGAYSKVLSSDLGQAVIANAATQVLLRQATQSVDVVADCFGLTAGEARLLLSARRGEGLLISGTHRVAFQAVASKKEHRLCIDALEFESTFRDSELNSGGGRS